VSHEHFVLDGYALADKSMTGYLAVLPYLCAFLNLDTCPNLGVVPDPASIEIHKVIDFDILAKLYVACNLPHSQALRPASAFFF
jgi:hypothetical protein